MSKLAVPIGIGSVVLLVAGWLTVVSAQQQEEKASAQQVCLLKVEGMTCGGCEAAVKNAAKKIDGVKDAKVSHPKGAAEITYDPAKTTPDAIAKTITDKTGFKAAVAPKEKKQARRAEVSDDLHRNVR